MKKIILLALLLNSIFSFSQEVKKMKGKTTEGWEKYYVLVSDTTKRQGEYKVTSYTPPFKELINGNYNLDKKEGLWIEKFNQKGHKIKVSGLYKNNIKTGKWVYNDTEGNLVQEYDYDTNELVFSKECSDKYNCHVSILGGFTLFRYELSNHISSYDFWKDDKEKKFFQFKNTITFFINIDGTISEIEYKDKINDLRLLKFIEDKIYQSNGKWLIAKNNNEKIKEKVSVPITISIQY